jgi:Co/Zn/Cd efflux system component
MTPTPFNIAITAGFYSQLAGVLAGFAFAALILLLTVRLAPPSTPPTTPSPFARSTRVLVVAFVGLVLTSVNYAVLAGDTSNSPRSALLELLAGLGFASSGALLLYAIALTFDGVNRASGPVAHADLVFAGN